MKINIQSPHINVSEKNIEAITAKFNRLSKSFDRIMQCDVILKKENSTSREGFVVEVKLAVPGNDLFAKEMADSYATAADKVRDNLVSQINKYKSKLNHKGKPADTFIAIDQEPHNQ